ncbi:SCO family protein [Asticcacaulis sp. YBE204]|uniref:SCO family protein n=1 Tax=Asticcacaulis sp. YBE204 TaxID=1282363 RepID=UPI0003C3E876|nr:SCO family protein [Asticcacaulis sp. YBE204]ESQ81015.1 photosynthetic protein synthase I [Asticcacaulis sp. YBE204]
MRLTIIALLVVGFGALAAIYWSSLLNKPVTTTTVDSSVRIGGPFTLTDQYGQPQTEAVLNGKWTAVFFGFTYCPDICPLTLQTLDQAKKKLGKDGDKLQFVFITVDPERDTPEILKAYLDSGGFPKGVIGLTGTPEQIAAAAKAYRATYDKVGDGPDYTMNHTSVIYLMNPKGEFVSPLTHGLTPEKSADVIRRAMKE